MHLTDPGRMPFDGVVADSNVGLREGADRIDISDSYSSLGPEAMKLFVSSLRSGLERPVPLSMHTHNDFGLANASAIATACSGAYPDVAVNGLSYRSGFASLEEVVVALELLCGSEERHSFGEAPVAVGPGGATYANAASPAKAGDRTPRAPSRPPHVNDRLPARDLSTLRVLLRTGDRRCADGLVWTVHPGNAVIKTKLERVGLTADESAIRKYDGV